MTPLLLAIYDFHNRNPRRSTEIVNLLLAEDGIDVNLCSGRDRNTPLMLAVDLGWVEVVESLLARDDLDPNIVDNGDHVLLHSVFLGREVVSESSQC
jgi:ankyrin repeat protein